MWRKIKKYLLHFYEKNSLQVIISLVFTSVAVCLILIMSFFYQNKLIQSSKTLLDKSNVQVVNQVSKHLDSYIHSTMSMTNTIYRQTLNKYDINQQQPEVLNNFNRLKELNQTQITSISLFDQTGGLLLSTKGGKIRDNLDTVSQPWFFRAISNIENSHFSLPYVENIFDGKEDTYPWVFSLSQAIEYQEDNLTKQGVLLINLNLSKIEEICKNVDLGILGYLYIMDESGKIIYHPKQKLIQSQLFLENNVKTLTYSEGSTDETFEKNERIVTKKLLGYTGWQLIGISYKHEFASLYKTQFVWFFSALCMLLLFLINYVLSRLVAKPIENLEKSVEKIEQNIDDIDFETSGTQEIQHLSLALQSMAKSLRALMIQGVTQEKKKRQSEMAILQAQINPHFLYNTLDSAVWMIENKRFDGAITMITSLAKFFRISLNRGKDVVTIEQEITHVESYLKIQALRYKEKFDYQLSVEENIKSLGVIKLIIQPLVENAIYHGVENAYDETLIEVNVFQEGDVVVFEVKDDGVGMSQQQVEALLSGKSQSEKSSGVGFKNVLERLNLWYDGQAVVHVESERDEGTTVTLQLPRLSVLELEKKGDLEND